MKVSVQLFAAARDAANAAAVPLELPENATVAMLREQLVQQCPALTALQNTLHIAVNSRYATPDQVISSDDEIACFPPVSGG